MTSVASAPITEGRTGTYGRGLLIALSSAAAFGLSGTFARSLLDLGWSPSAVVSVRILGAFVVLLGPCLLLVRRIGLPRRGQVAKMFAYGLVAVAGAQLCFFSAVQYLSVGVALLLEYSAPVLLICRHWVRSRRRPATPVLIGAVLSVVGLMLVLDLRGGLTLNPVGVAWGLAAAVCLCGYFILSDGGGKDEVHPLLMITVGTGVGGSAVFAIGLTGVLPLAAHTGTVDLAGAQFGWWVPTLLLILVCAVFSYLSGIVAVRRLGSSIASFVALTEVIFAVVFAFVLLGQQPGPIQLLGGALVLAGIAVVQRRPGV